MQPGPTIRSVQAITTGWARQHREHRTGSRWPKLWWALTSRSWVTVPVAAYVIDHRDGIVLFDTGIDPAVATDPDYVDGPVGRFFLDRLFRFAVTRQDGLEPKLRALGIDARAVGKAVISHLHFDHIGGIAAIPQAQLLVSEAEWRHLREDPHPERDFILKGHIEIPGARWHPMAFTPTDDPVLAPFGGVVDVMGDGAMLLLPTPGHTAGSLSMLIRDGGRPPLLLVGDLTYDVDRMLADHLPGTGDPEMLRDSFAKVRALKHALPDLVILPTHDPVAFETMPAAWLPQETGVAA